MPTELTAAERWLYSTLHGDATLSALVGGRVYSEEVPSDGAFPCVLFSFYSPTPDTVATGDIRVMSQSLYIVRAVGAGNDALSIQPAAARIDALLQSEAGGNADGFVLNCAREQPFRFNEHKSVGSTVQRYTHLGGIYRLSVQGTE